MVFLPKNTTPPSDALRFRDLFEQGNQLVVASRNIKGGETRRTTPFPGRGHGS